MNSINSQLNNLVAQIKQYSVLLKPYFDSSLSLLEYADSVSKTLAVSTGLLTRQRSVGRIISEKINRLFPKKAFYLEVFNNDAPGLAFNIADHHQVLNHPFLYSSNILMALRSLFGEDNSNRPIIVISSGDIPPNNFFSKGGFSLGGKQVPIFSASERETCSYFLPKRNYNFLDRLRASRRLHLFTSGEINFLQSWQNEIMDYDFSQCSNYCDQITVIVNHQWKKLFRPELRKKVPELYYLTQEEVVREFLCQILNEDNFITATLFSEDFRNSVLKNFQGIVVAWNEKENKGTHFFWRKHPHLPRALRMYVSNNYLVPVDSRFAHLKVKLERNVILSLLHKQEIFPSLFLIFSCLNFYAGIKPLTGFGSRIYLEYFKTAWVNTLANSDYTNELTQIQELDLSGMVAGLPLVFSEINGKYQVDFAADTMFKGGLALDYLTQVSQMPLGKLMSIGAIDIYKYIASKYIPAHKQLSFDFNLNDVATQILSR